ncbi:type VI secretion system baseplate subunit TssE [Arenibacterium halophilum]|jgi:type VI secretion system protein ImpF|uniref:Type VI secretion system baseplate subunit TssE n=1 Tax=Arenibacterium halophilum TaxID=2583821 RepID=A0ABY2X7P7_9RHOB|nr:type VI secretion system baseplate subunit TssE [Arenibacterium halophilum]MAY87791.1 type VI secretion system baseplate subunit TssE [Pseudooceanicola sp.]TMV11353.1 type VI secretion system baseplate subunit TssE [Arenibacterium halophilum]|tara:strand:+ start:5666 stop:6163 length:498 start_codon:yes stop_codon:yes gene_type:complete
MADKTLSERLQPSLLDRLTDLEPGQTKESRESRVIDVSRLRDIIQRDLSWLLNTNNIENTLDPEEFPMISRSVLNYGLREVSGEFSTAERAELIRKSIERAIETHEPRIIKGSVDVSLSPDDDKGQMTVALVIRADMWAQPLPMELYLRSSVDVTTGEVMVERSM